MESLGFHHLALQVRDVERVAAFYRDLLHLPELQRFHEADGTLRSIWLSIRSGGSAADGFLAVERAAAGARPPDGLGPSMVALRIAPGQRTRVEAELAAAGVAVERRTGWTSYVRDPEGTWVGLSHHPHDAGPEL